MNESIELPVNREYDCDVLVVGAGVAGFTAAVCAARRGARVILVDKNGCIGGSATTGLVGPFMSVMDPTGNFQVVKGFLDEFIQRMIEKNGAIHPLECRGGDSYSAYRTPGHIGVVPFNAECFKFTAEEICNESKVKILYHMLLVEVSVDDDKRITRAYFATKNGIYSIAAKVFIDTTGDADLSKLSGAKILFGNEEGRTQVSSLFFIVDNVDKTQLDAYMEKHPQSTDHKARFFIDEIAKGRQDGTFPCGRHVFSAFQSPNGMWRINMTQYDDQIDFNDPEQVTGAEIECRTQIPKIISFLKTHVPGFSNIRLVHSSEMLGVRESGRIEGEYYLTGEEVAQGTSFPDTIAIIGDSIDIHTNSKSIYVTSSLPAHIPYRSLLPKGIPNLIVAGRCLSADQIAHSAVRVMPPCFATGQAAGTAAAIAVASHTDLKKIDIPELRKALSEDGAYLG
ncbi:MAG TPA: FAD-dependent oxidoreductase [Sphaerochaeta sp.]|nr:FAD-dependent oxidoreductase [Sphaerochaeta sp.]HQB05190.1 FAD-dependent oxidoreductase [Sphaerochaeta sp.]